MVLDQPQRILRDHWIGEKRFSAKTHSDIKQWSRTYTTLRERDNWGVKGIF